MAKKICKNCKHFSYEDGDRESYDKGYGFCNAPIPQCIESYGEYEVDEDENASECPCYKRKK